MGIRDKDASLAAYVAHSRFVDNTGNSFLWHPVVGDVRLMYISVSGQEKCVTITTRKDYRFLDARGLALDKGLAKRCFWQRRVKTKNSSIPGKPAILSRVVPHADGRDLGFRE